MKRKHKIFGIGVVVILSVVAILLSISQKVIKVWHWTQIGGNLISYSPWLIPISWASWGTYMLVTIIKKPFIYYYFVGVIWLIFECIWTFFMIQTWFPGII